MKRPHVEPHPIPLIKSKLDDKPNKYFIKIKFCRYPTSYLSDLYNFKMAFFYNGDREEFLLFVQNFNMNLATSGTLPMSEKIQYICTIVRGEALCQFDLLSADVEGAKLLNMRSII